MLPCISVANMRQSDAHTIAHRVPSMVLMHRAAIGVYLSVEWRGDVAIAVGSGNNGGDGYALGCILARHGIPCRIVMLTDKRSDDGAYYAAEAESLGVPMASYAPGAFTGSDVIVDCLLGTGFQGQVRPAYAAAIEEINNAGAYVVSVDINSGMDGDTGAAAVAVRSDLTVTIGFVKRGLVAPEAGQYVKRLVCVDIGIDLDREEWQLCAPGETAENAIHCPPWLDREVVDARMSRRLLCIGDSNTFGYKPYGERYPATVRWTGRLEQMGHAVENQGVNGASIPEDRAFPALARLLKRCRPDVVTVMLGSNDVLLEGRSVVATTERMEALLHHLMVSTDAKILLIAPPPMALGVWVPTRDLVTTSLELARHYRALAQRLGVGFTDAGDWGVTVTEDGVHFTAQGHERFAAGLALWLAETEGGTCV